MNTSALESFNVTCSRMILVLKTGSLVDLSLNYVAMNRSKLVEIQTDLHVALL